MMTESEYHLLADQTLMDIENYLEAQEDQYDFEFEITGGVLTIIFANQTKMVINKQAPMRELWLAAKSGGYHFQYDAAQKIWFSQRDQREFFACLAENLALHHAL